MTKEQDEESKSENYSKLLDGLDIPKKSKRIILSALEDLVPTQDTSPATVQKIKRKVYGIVESCISGYCGRYDQMPAMALASDIRAELDNAHERRIQILPEVESELIGIAESLEASRRTRRKKSQ